MQRETYGGLVSHRPSIDGVSLQRPLEGVFEGFAPLSGSGTSFDCDFEKIFPPRSGQEPGEEVD